MDESDKKLIQALIDNERAPLTDLARQLGIARTTVQSRIERLEKAGTIRGYTLRMGYANRPMIRDDKADLIYLTAQEKYEAIVEDIKACVKRGQPTLVGTVSIENSELISRFLQSKKIPHQVLNAKYHGNRHLEYTLY